MESMEETTEIANPDEQKTEKTPFDPFTDPDNLVEPENPLPDASMDDLSETMRSCLKNAGWDRLMPVQRKTMPYMMAGRDTVVQSKTGSGKTGAFVIPLLEIVEAEHPYPQALILVPTRELAVQVEAEIRRLDGGRGIRSVALYGGVGYNAQLKALRDGVHLVVATPGRLFDLLERRALDFISLRDLVMDEADEMLSMGFYPDMKRIKTYLPKQHCTTLFSATIPETVKSLAREFQTPNAGFLSLSRDRMTTDSLDHVYHVVDPMEKDKALVRVLETENPSSCIVFCNMKKDVEYLGSFLKSYGFSVGVLSGDVPQKIRQQTLGRFRQEEIQVLIATDVAARGIDISHVSHVLIHDHPDDSEVYIHRSGRTARAGNAGLAISLVSSTEEFALKKTKAKFSIPFIKKNLPTRDEVDSVIRQSCLALLDQEKRTLTQKQKGRIRRYLPLVQELASEEEESQLLAYLLDKYFWEKHNSRYTLDSDNDQT